MHSRGCLHLNVASPLVSYVEVSEGQGCHHDADAHIADEECGEIRGEQDACAGVTYETGMAEYESAR